MDTDVLFLKIERLRRLYRSEILTVPVERGDNGTFGLGLSDDNEVLRLHHDANAQVIEPGDQVISVEGVPLGRGPLSRLRSTRPSYLPYWHHACPLRTRPTRISSRPARPRHRSTHVTLQSVALRSVDSSPLPLRLRR